ncbi:putative glutamate receptor [Folsomia candida]|uniref:Putative glutamate receptor n=1 Tax=Folsomia candida TaxID=158441 RepID=A0A226CVR8_FOLCA|nr:putative glutamate receptor [Folsomia candida]
MSVITSYTLLLFSLMRTSCQVWNANSDDVIPSDLLQHVKKCDIVILRDKISSNYFSFLKGTDLPSTVLLMSAFYDIGHGSLVSITEIPYVVNVLNSRPGPNKIVIWVSAYLLSESDNLVYTRCTSRSNTECVPNYMDWIILSTVTHYTHRCKQCHHVYGSAGWEWLRSTKNLYSIVLSKSNVAKTLEKLQLSSNVEFENFFIAILPSKKTSLFQLCIKKGGQGMRTRDNYICKNKDNFMKQYETLESVPSTWVGHYEIQFKKENQNLPPPSANPFDTKLALSIPVYIAVIIVSSSNATFTLTDNYRKTDMYIEKPENIVDHDDELSELVSASGMQFLSCYTEPYMNFNFYLMPFKPELWCSLIFSVILSCLSISLYSWKRRNGFSFSVWLSLISQLFDDFAPLPRFMRNTQFVRLIFIAWGPVAVLLTNCYSGLMISEFNAPNRNKGPQTFEDLICRNAQLLDGVVADGFSRFLKDSDSPMKYINYWSSLGSFSNHGKKIIYPGFTGDDLLLLLLMNPSHGFEPLGFNRSNSEYTTSVVQTLVEKDIVNCNKKSAFVSTLVDVQHEKDYLSKKYPSKNFLSGNTPIFNARQVWTFKGGGRYKGTGSISPVQRNLQALVSSGIYYRLKHETKVRMNLRRVPAENDTQRPSPDQDISYEVYSDTEVVFSSRATSWPALD